MKNCVRSPSQRQLLRPAAREELNWLGYIWCPPRQLPPIVWSAGIPSLMQHVLDQASPSGRGPKRGKNDAPAD